MIFSPTDVERAWIVEPERFEDERGFFARTWDSADFSERGLDGTLVQASISFNHEEGTLRGMHYQAPPYPEAKLIRCTAGAIFDVAIDLRPKSSTYLAWTGVELSAHNRLALYIPEGCAHGFLTLADDVEVAYLMSAAYEPAAARGVRFDDPAFGIVWPAEVRVVNERDRSYPDFAA